MQVENRYLTDLESGLKKLFFKKTQNFATV
jgi:hypothetical protein